MEKHRLNMIVALAILVTSIWLIWTLRIWDSIGNLLLGSVIAFFIWALLRSEEPAKLSGFLVKSFVVSYVITSIVWFVSLGSLSLVYSAFLGLWLVYIVLPRSLLPVAIFVLIYGIFRVKLRAWKILLSSWYVFIFAVHAAYDVWWSLSIQPYLHDSYQSGAGATALDILLALLALFIAGVFTIAYAAITDLKGTEG